jgi:hypothetical protein
LGIGAAAGAGGVAAANASATQASATVNNERTTGADLNPSATAASVDGQLGVADPERGEPGGELIEFRDAAHGPQAHAVQA